MATAPGLTFALVNGRQRRANPHPYSRRQLGELGRRLDRRWPRLPDGEAQRWIRRWGNGVSPYSRVRSHAIRLQLDAVIALALCCGLRRHEIRSFSVDWMHHDNAYIVVWENGSPWSDTWREVPYTDGARAAVQTWLDFRALVGPEHDRPWLNLWDERSIQQPMRRDTFDKLLRTYVGEGWTLKRLRDTCAVTWVRAGLPLEHLRQTLGLATLEAVLPYAALASGTPDRTMQRLDARFSEALEVAI
jgi:integrase